jgi:hypothetical protein
VPTIAKHPTTGIINVILGEGEMITEKFNSEKVVIYRRDSSTDWQLELVKPLGALASPEQLRVNAPQKCDYNMGSDHNPNPLHQHEDGTWWHFDELWQLENGPFDTYEEAYNSLAEYCTGLETAQAVAQEMAEEMGNVVTTEDIVKKMIKKLFPEGVENESETNPAGVVAPDNN